MRKIGLIGGTGPESTLVYYHDIVYGVQQRSGRAYFPNLTVESLSVFDVLEFCKANDFGGLTAYLLKGMESLAAAGAEYGALTGITPHIVYEELQKRSPIPIISMVQTACDYVKEKGYRKIALLGTKPTMDADFFQTVFHRAGISVVTPSKNEKDYIGAKIESELELGKVVPQTKQEFCAIANRMIMEEKAEAIVLGCTELPMIFDSVDLAVPYMDVMQIHINTLIELALM